jgi:hypothetical protein
MVSRHRERSHILDRPSPVPLTAARRLGLSVPVSLAATIAEPALRPLEASCPTTAETQLGHRPGRKDSPARTSKGNHRAGIPPTPPRRTFPFWITRPLPALFQPRLGILRPPYKENQRRRTEPPRLEAMFLYGRAGSGWSIRGVADAWRCVPATPVGRNRRKAKGFQWSFDGKDRSRAAQEVQTRGEKSWSLKEGATRRSFLRQGDTSTDEYSEAVERRG